MGWVLRANRCCGLQLRALVGVPPYPHPHPHPTLVLTLTLTLTLALTLIRPVALGWQNVR
jgi:hypothetical protein